MSTTYFSIPDFLKNWPWPRKINPHYEECKADSSAWCESVGAFTPKAQEAFKKCDFNLLASLAYPHLNRDGCRIACDMMGFFWVFDEHSDVSPGNVVRRQADIIMDALRHPHKARPSGEWIGGEFARQFWVNALRTATPTCQRRFIDTTKLYTDAIVQQAEDRDHNRIRDIKGYLDIRRDNGGVKPSFAIIELSMNLPDRFHSDPVIERLTMAANDMITISNDVYSYNVEQACGVGDHNLVTVVMKENGTDLDGALRWIEDAHDRIATQFLADYKEVPSFGDPKIDTEVAMYVDGMAEWVRANTQWSFESQRYFGPKGLEIKATRTVALLPKRVLTGTGNPAERGYFVDSDHGGMSSCRRDINAVCFVQDGSQIHTTELELSA